MVWRADHSRHRASSFEVVRLANHLENELKQFSVPSPATGKEGIAVELVEHLQLIYAMHLVMSLRQKTASTQVQTTTAVLIKGVKHHQVLRNDQHLCSVVTINLCPRSQEKWSLCHQWALQKRSLHGGEDSV